MIPDLASPVPTGGATAPQAAADQVQLTADYESFLRLLTAQISNQDPLAPMESTEFVSQLAQLSQVEQAVQTNANLEKMTAALSTSALMTDLSLIGREVTLPGDEMRLETGTPAAIGYELAAPAQSVTLRITDTAGTVVRSLPGSSGTAGTLVRMAWDGRDDTGTPVAPGLYRLSVSAVDASGTPVAAQGFTSARVDSVAIDPAGATLRLDTGRLAGSADIREVR